MREGIQFFIMKNLGTTAYHYYQIYIIFFVIFIQKS